MWGLDEEVGVGLGGLLDVVEEFLVVGVVHEGEGGDFAEFDGGLVVGVDVEQGAHVAGGGFEEVDELAYGVG